MAVPVWSPSQKRIEDSNLRHFLDRISTVQPAVQDFPTLYQWSVRDPERFWAEVWGFCDVRSSRVWDQVVDDVQRMPGAHWFEGARLNFAENLLRYDDDRTALVSWNEAGRHSSLTYRELRREVGRLASALRATGIQQGDRVAGFLPNLPVAVTAMLATASLGAVWSSCSPDFGAKGVLDRFGQIRPRVLFAADGYRYAGKEIDTLPRLADVVGQLPEIETVVVVPYLRDSPDPGRVPRAVLYRELLDQHDGEPLAFRQLPFDHPLYIMYSSGTTGLPKCMVHGAGGTLLQHLKELVLHTDLKRSDTIFYYTTCGWMMWNWLVSSLAVGATVVLYDGSPFHPTAGVLFDLAEAEKVTIFGTSAKYLALAEKKNAHPKERDLSPLRTILSTGSPLAPESYDYVYSRVKDDVCLSSISGGTDLISCFALGNPLAPVYRGELQTRGLGMKVEIFDEAGRAVVGTPGELVCTMAFPSMPVSFWNDPDGSKYRAAYFEEFPGVWRHGDWAELTPRGGLIIYGRSDATLNPGGVRIGTAEIYRQVEQLEEVVESIVITQDWEGDVRLVLFVKLREGLSLDNVLRQRIKTQIRENASPHHVPKVILQVADIPRTISGKITELAVRNVIHGRPVKNVDALANPEALDLYRDLEELKA